MTLQQLEYFLAALERRLVQRRRRALHLAQPSLSEQVRRLEAELGVALFHARRPRPRARPRPARALRPHAEAALGAVAEARASRSSPCASCAAASRPSARSGPRASTSAPRSSPTSAGATPRCACGSSARTRPRSSTPCATGDLEAGMVALPIDDTRPRRPADHAATSSSTSAPTRRACASPMTIERARRARR